MAIKETPEGKCDVLVIGAGPAGLMSMQHNEVHLLPEAYSG